MLTKSTNSTTPLKKISQYAGCLVGLAIGDALGAEMEFWGGEAVCAHIDTHGLEMRAFTRGGVCFPVGFYTDDTCQAICLAESLVEKGFDLDDQFSRYRKWFLEGYATPLGDKSYGIGQQTLKVLMSGVRHNHPVTYHDEDASGNGSLMRCAPIGLCYHGNLEEIKEKSLHASHITHDNQIASWSCVVLNSIISLIISGYDRSEILPMIRQVYKDQIPQVIDDCLALDYANIDYMFPISGYALDTLRIAIWSWMNAETFEESIENAIRMGNDTDTFAAVTGAIAGSYWGIESIPSKWKNNLMRSEYIQSLSEKLFKK